MSKHPAERSISLYKLTTGPLRCLAPGAPCHPKPEAISLPKLKHGDKTEKEADHG